MRIHKEKVEMVIAERMNRAMASEGKTLVLNPRSKFNVKRKIKDVRLTFGNNIELSFWRALPSMTSKLFTITPTAECMESFTIMD